MNSRIPTTEEQITGVLTGSWSPETHTFVSDPTSKLTIKRGELLDYLRKNPDVAKEYLKRWEALRPAVDINVMWKEKGGYKVAWMTWGGQPSLIQEFRDLNDAVAEHACRQTGIRE